MPVEIKEIIIKASVENKTESEQKPCNEGINTKKLNIQLLLNQVNKKIKSQNER